MREGRIVKDLVLIGGGHSHVAVLKRLGMAPVPGLQVTLITPSVTTAYSGMLPGVIAGHYTQDQAEIDLVPLCRFAGARLFVDEATAIDPGLRTICCGDRPDVHYDALSIDIGISPNLGVPGAAEHVIPVKPINGFMAQLPALLARVQSGQVQTIAVVGGGAGGVELVLALGERLKREKLTASLALYTGSEHILDGYDAAVQEQFSRVMAGAHVSVHKSFRVAEVRADALVGSEGQREPVDAVFWATDAAPQAWLAETGLSLSERGFLVVRDSLQTLSHDEVFAVGDTADMLNHPRPKAGVFAVRQGPPLAENLLRFVLGKPLKDFVPQSRYLSLISTGPKHAVGTRGGSTFAGRWVWRMKDLIDRRFIEKYNVLPDMIRPPQKGLLAGLEEQMPCGGCAAKLPAEQLSAALSNIQPVESEDVLVGLDQPDDAAVVRVPDGHVQLHSVDYFRAFVDDPYVLGQIAVNHALSDIYAMGAEPTTVLAIVTLPYAEPDKSQQLLKQIMNGAHRVLKQERVVLIGGHTGEGAELSLGFVANGTCEPDRLMTKSALVDGDHLILTKPLGTGVLFAAEMQLRARGEHIAAAQASMLVSNRAAMACAREAGVTAATDITGFGLGGHLLEMLQASGCSCTLSLDQLPALEGALALLRDGVRSSLHEDNAKVRTFVQAETAGVDAARVELLFDPQTAGGLLLAVKPAEVEAILVALHTAGLSSACDIGTVTGNSAPLIRVS